MAIKINYSDKYYQKGHEIRELSDLIINNMELLHLLSQACMIYEKAKKDNKNIKVEDMLEKSINICVFTGDVSTDIALDFKKKWMNMSAQKIGIVLEQIIAVKGPYKNILNNVDHSRDVKVYKTNLDNNFDVVFFEKKHNLNNRCEQTINIDGYIEFHECKKNICNHIPNDINKELKKDMKNKIELIKRTKELVVSGGFYIPTFYVNVKAQEKYLDVIGCGYVEILNIDKLIERYCS